MHPIGEENKSEPRGESIEEAVSIAARTKLDQLHAI